MQVSLGLQKCRPSIQVNSQIVRFNGVRFFQVIDEVSTSSMESVQSLVCTLVMQARVMFKLCGKERV
jgi:hypothetical protein